MCLEIDILRFQPHIPSSNELIWEFKFSRTLSRKWHDFVYSNPKALMSLVTTPILLTFQEANYFFFHNSHIPMMNCVQHKLQISSVFLLADSERTAPVK